jgi:acyl-CoA synthetase (AMP-forming)/AMP-acid ligase II
MNGTEREGNSAGPIDPQVGIWAGERSKKVDGEQSEDIERLVDFLGLVLDNVYSGIIVCDLHCRIVYMNQVYAELLQTDCHKAVGKPIQNYFPKSQLARALKPDGWLHTGDLGYMDEDGFVFVTGRLKELIIKGGVNIAPREIDEAVYCYDAILDAAAVGIPDEHYGEEIMVCCTIKPGHTCTEEELREHCLKTLGKYKTPKSSRCSMNCPKDPRERSSDSSCLKLSRS